MCICFASLSRRCRFGKWDFTETKLFRYLVYSCSLRIQCFKGTNTPVCWPFSCNIHPISNLIRLILEEAVASANKVLDFFNLFLSKNCLVPEIFRSETRIHVQHAMNCLKLNKLSENCCDDKKSFIKTPDFSWCKYCANERSVASWWAWKSGEMQRITARNFRKSFILSHKYYLGLCENWKNSCLHTHRRFSYQQALHEYSWKKCSWNLL